MATLLKKPLKLALVQLASGTFQITSPTIFPKTPPILANRNGWIAIYTYEDQVLSNI